MINKKEKLNHKDYSLFKEDDFKEILYGEDEIREKCREIGEKINRDYKDKNLVLVGILKGSLMFMGDLMKEIKLPVEVDFMAVSSYGLGSESSGIVRILKDLDMDIENKDILFVEDIIDSGNTLDYLTRYMLTRKASSVEIVCLLDKPSRRLKDVAIKYKGFEIPDDFIVGYGIDYAEKYRNLPFIASLKREVYEGKGQND